MTGSALQVVQTSDATVAEDTLLDRLSRWHARCHGSLDPGQWGVICVPEQGAPHWLAGLHGLSEDEAVRSWRRCWSHVVVWGSVQVLVRCVLEDDSTPSVAMFDPLPPPGAVPAQLELAHAAPTAFNHARLCVDCGGPVELHRGRDGRPRKACETCRPPVWPRRGERWWVDTVCVVVQGSRMVRPGPDAPRRREVRFREVESGRQRSLTGPDWRALASRTPPDQSEEAA